MAILLRHKETGERFVLVGTGLGTSATARPGLLFGNLAPSEEESMTTAVAVCDGTGTIRWVRSTSLSVISVDGIPPSELLSAS